MDDVHGYEITFERIMKIDARFNNFWKGYKERHLVLYQGKALVSDFFVIVETDSDIEPLQKQLGNMRLKGSDVLSSLQIFKGH